MEKYTDAEVRKDFKAGGNLKEGRKLDINQLFVVFLNVPHSYIYI